VGKIFNKSSLARQAIKHLTEKGLIKSVGD
jgi:ribosomal protein S25